MQIPVVISISANNNRNDIIPSQLPGIVPQPILQLLLHIPGGEHVSLSEWERDRVQPRYIK